jgi:hypothetical protein
MTWTRETAARQMEGAWLNGTQPLNNRADRIAFFGRHLQAAHDADRSSPAARDGGVEAVAKAICEVRRRHACSAKPFHPYGIPPETAIKSCGCGFWVENEACARAALTAARVPEMRAALEQAQDCIRGETPEDCTPEEAREDTLQKIRKALGL